MDIGIVSKRYAKALYAYADENGRAETVYREMQALADSYRDAAMLRPILENPVVAKEEKLKLLYEAAGGKVSDEYKRFVALVLDERRERFMQFMTYSYMNLFRKMNHIRVGKLITASPVKEETTERIKSMMAEGTSGTVELETSVDPSVMGGFIFEIDFNRLDASIAAQINKVRRQFIEKNRRIV